MSDGDIIQVLFIIAVGGWFVAIAMIAHAFNQDKAIAEFYRYAKELEERLLDAHRKLIARPIK